MRVFNSLTKRVEDVVPLDNKTVRMYHCGPTVYKRPHIGNYRAFINADLLRRTFEYLGYTVVQVMNITDVGHLTIDDTADAGGEDKLEQSARQRGIDPWQIAREIESEFFEDLTTLGCLRAHHYPRATEHIPEMITLIAQLVERGHAYETDGNVYFAIETFPEYGKLSGNRLPELKAGASGRTKAQSDKRNPHDFALWKHDPRHIMQWDSPWGRGFPGWHIECSAMAMKYLGSSFDIHTGGPDNKFPHHECEIAQAEAVTGQPLARFWLHSGYLEIGGKKMSKSAGKLYLVPELISLGYQGLDIRYLLLQAHWRSAIQFDLDLLDGARAARRRLTNVVRFEMAERPEGPSDPAVVTAVEEARRSFRAALEDDLNTPLALAALHELAGVANRLKPSRSDAKLVVETLREFDRVLGILEPETEATHELDAGLEREIEALVAERQQARQSGDFAAADQIREKLSSWGIEVIDTPQGPRWRKA